MTRHGLNPRPSDRGARQIRTGNTERLWDDPAREAEMRGRIPAGHWGRPEELVGAAVFLASGASDYVNGHLLAVDGGWLAR
ncbi:SDR family oxidoreductase [Streptosporangium sp. H16]|uniref:SDR family oxidoreductase n=1 Tax=Streptosporangium sp. H16 TaxID=3444184 RepID=UPI003F796423